MNKDSNILAEKYEAINDSFKNPFLKDEEGEPTPSKYDKAKELAKKAALKGGELAKKGAIKGGQLAKKGIEMGVDQYNINKSKGEENINYKNRSRMYASEFLKGEQSYQDLNKLYGVDETQMYDLLKKARIPVTAFGMYRGKAGRGVDVYNDYINKYKPAPIQKLGRGIKSFANYFRGKKKPEA